MAPVVTYHPSMDRSSPSAAESASAVSAALDPRTAEVSADIYGLIVREIPQLRSDKRVLALLESSVAENVGTMLHILQHSIDLEKVHAPAAAEEYARRLAQRGVPIAALGEPRPRRPRAPCSACRHGEPPTPLPASR